MTTAPLLESLSDDNLIAETKRLVAAERVATAALLRSLMEIDTRRLYLREGCSSLFTYCTHVLTGSGTPSRSRDRFAGSRRNGPNSNAITRHLQGHVTAAASGELSPR